MGGGKVFYQKILIKRQHILLLSFLPSYLTLKLSPKTLIRFAHVWSLWGSIETNLLRSKSQWERGLAHRIFKSPSSKKALISNQNLLNWIEELFSSRVQGELFRDKDISKEQLIEKRNDHQSDELGEIFFI